MTIIDRYVLRQVLMTSALAVAVLSVVLVLGNVFKRLLELLVNNDAPLELILAFISYILPFSLTFTVPWGFLTAVLLVFGKMSGENELIALRSTGTSMGRICIPVLMVALACVALCLWINLDVAPRAQTKMKDALYNIATSNPLAMFGSDKVIDAFPGKKIYVERSKGDQLENLLMYEISESNHPMRVVHARSGWLETDPVGKQILLHIYDARFEERDAADPENLGKIRQGITMQESTLPISLAELDERNKKKGGLSQLTIGELRDRVEGSSTELRTEISKRFSFSLASLAFALMGVPLAITAHRKETSSGFLLSLVVAFVYYFFIILADTLRGNAAARPELLVWLPNVLFIGIGSWMFARLSRR